MSGKVYLVGAGPGDADLLTVRASRLLQAADVVLHDALVSPEVLTLIRKGARVVHVGKRCGRMAVTQEEIHSLLISHAREGRLVVRLKGGDPMVFGRAGEEMEALREAGIEFEVVPGVTAALGAAAAAKVPLTDRRHSSRLILLTNHGSKGKAPSGWKDAISSDATLVVHMPGENYAGLAADLRAAGLDGNTPCVIVSRAASPGQQVLQTTLDHLAESRPLPAPALLIVGEVARNVSAASDTAGSLQAHWRETPETSGAKLAEVIEIKFTK